MPCDTAWLAHVSNFNAMCCDPDLCAYAMSPPGKAPSRTGVGEGGWLWGLGPVTAHALSHPCHQSEP